MNAQPLDLLTEEEVAQLLLRVGLVALAAGLIAGYFAAQADRRSSGRLIPAPCDCAIDAQQRIDSLADRLDVVESAPQPKRRRRSRS